MVWSLRSYGAPWSLLLARSPSDRDSRRPDRLQLAPNGAVLHSFGQRFATCSARVIADRVPTLYEGVDEEDPRVVDGVGLDARDVQVQRDVVASYDVPVDVSPDLEASQMRYPWHARRAQSGRLRNVQAEEHASVVLVGVRLARTAEFRPAETLRPLVTIHGAVYVDAIHVVNFFFWKNANTFRTFSGAASSPSKRSSPSRPP
jgi:hypothetical protein